LGASQRDTGTRVPEESFAVAAIAAFADYRLHAVMTVRARAIFIGAFSEAKTDCTLSNIVGGEHPHRSNSFLVQVVTARFAN